MDTRQLKYFVSIVELGSMLAASKHLGVAQPSLSQHVRQLERELGVELLVRSPRGVSPTASGQILFERAASILNALDLAASEIKARAGEVQGDSEKGLSGVTGRSG